MSLTTITIFGLQVMDRVTSADYVEWAVGVLSEGHDSPNLRALAALDDESNAFEAEKYFRRALQELKIPEPDRMGKLNAFGRYVAEQILTNKVSPEAGQKMLYDLYLASGYQRKFRVWDYLDDALSDIKAGSYPLSYETATAENFNEVVKTEAQKFLEQITNESAVI